MKTTFKIGLAAVLIVALVVSLAAAKRYRAAKDVWLGVSIESVDYDLADKHGLSINYGAFVLGVQDDSPAEEAGLEKGDVIVSLDQEKVTDSDDLIDALSDYEDGDEVTLEVLREGKSQKFKVVLEDRPRGRRSFRTSLRAPGAWSYFISRDGSHIGVSLSSLTRQLGEYFGAKKGKGALIEEVLDDSPAEEAGLKAGDVIIAIDGDDVSDPEDVREVTREKDKGEKVDLTVLRDKKEMKVQVEITEWDGDYYSGDYLYHYDALEGLEDLEALKSLKDLDALEALDVPDAPEVDIYIPKIRDRYRHDFSDSELEEFERDMRELKKELKELKKELKEELKEIRLKLD